MFPSGPTVLEKPMRSSLFLISVFLIACLASFAQTGPEKGGHEIELWAGGGHSVAGGRGDTGTFNAGLRYGWILTGRTFPAFLRGRFEYAVDAVPVFFVFQPANTAYGAGFDPLGLKWNFERHGRISPYLELTGGVCSQTTMFPPERTPSTSWTRRRSACTSSARRHNWSVELRYMHISNAGLATPNPGVNTVQVTVRDWKILRASAREITEPPV